jgi:hypothetical protein
MGNYSIELCPKTNRGAFIHKTVVGLPEVSGYEIPLMPTACEFLPEEGWYVPLMPDGGCVDVMQDIHWKQESQRVFTAFGGSVNTTEYWNFSITPPQGLFEGSCKKCFPRAATIRLLGDLGFNGGIQISYGKRVVWRVHRNDLPFPGEFLIAIADCPDGDGEALRMLGVCASPDCETPDADCIWGRSSSIATTGSFLIIGSIFFATPTWTGGVLVDYYTQELGWAGVEAGSLSFPDCVVYGNPTLQYKINVEGELRTVTSVGFAGYGIGTHVLLKKLGVKYSEPFSDSCLGVDEGSPAELIELEKIGVSIHDSLTPFSPPLSQLSVLPIDSTSPITVYTSYDVRGSTGWYTELMTVDVDSDGECSGDCTDGLLNLQTGVWLRNIVWANIPNADKYEDRETVIQIVCTYTKREEACIGVAIFPWHVMGMGG